MTVLRALALLILLALPAAACAMKIPEGPGADSLPLFRGKTAVPNPVPFNRPPRHPFMGPNGRSNLHEDAYQTDVHAELGPLGDDMRRTSTFYASDCASITFDSKGRIVTTCVGLVRPVLKILDPVTLAELASRDLPLRKTNGLDAFTSFGGGGYFFLDDKDRATLPTSERHILVIGETDPEGFKVEHDYDVSGVVGSDDSIISVLPDWSGRLWFATALGVVGNVDPASGAIQSTALGEPIGNSFAVDETGGVFIVTDKAMYRFDAGPAGAVRTTWRETYDNIGVKKPGQTETGSGTTPTLMDNGLVAITDNADPMKVLVYQRGAAAAGNRLVCSAPVFERGASNTDQSLIGIGNSIIASNNYGYSGPAATEAGKTTTPGIERVDVGADGACRTVWRSNEIAPTSVNKVSALGGLLYAWTKDANDRGEDGWYLTAIDFRTGKTVFKQRGGEGLGFNNNYAPVTFGPDGSMYIGTLGGMVSLRDRTPPTLSAGGTTARGKPRLKLKVRCGRRVRLSVTGKDRGLVKRASFYSGRRRVARDGSKPFSRRILRRRLGRRVSVKVVLGDGRRATVRRRLRCR